jgi:hypothetical protein
MTEYWFKPKRFGYGATPVTWQGWASSLAVVFVMLGVMRFMIIPMAGGVGHSDWEVILGLAVVVALIVGFCWFAKAKTEGEWRWRWGKDSN